MKAMILEGFGEKLKLKNVQEKELKPGYAKIKVKACGICHTDLKILSGTLPICKEIQFPHILGHEIAGKVVEVESEVKDIHVGDRVVVSFYSGCGKCIYCNKGEDALCENLQYWAGFRDWGGYAEYITVPARALTLIPNTSAITYVKAAIIPDAVATVYGALKRKADIKPEDNVIIIGVGGLGLHAVQLAKYFQAKVIAIDKDEKHLNKALEEGADFIVKLNSDEVENTINHLMHNKKADSVIDIVGTQSTINLGINSLKKGGKLIIVGYEPQTKVFIKPLEVLLKEIQILGSRGSSKKDIEETLKLIASGHIHPIIDKIRPFKEVNELHQQLKDGKIIGRSVIVF